MLIKYSKLYEIHMHPPLHDSFPTTLYPLSLLFIVEQLPII